VTTQEIKVPDIGGVKDVEIIEVCVAVGEEVSAEQSLVVVESEKASMEIPSPVAGKVRTLKVSEGDTVNEGDLLLEVEAGSEPAVVEMQQQPRKQPEQQREELAQTELAKTEASDTGATIQIVAPDLGSAETVEVIELNVAPGDSVAEGDSLLVMESDKASMELPAPAAGEVVELTVSEGAHISAGDVVGVIKRVQVVVSPPQASASVPTPVKEGAAREAAKSSTPIIQAAPPQRPAVVPVASSNIYAGPSVRLLARELGVSLGDVGGSGPKGRIQKEDVQKFVKSHLAGTSSAPAKGSGIPVIPEVDFSYFGEVEQKPISKMHKVTAVNMSRAWLNVPHVTQFDEADITELEEFRTSLKKEMEAKGTKLTPLPFLIKAVATALKTNPKFNASLHADGEHIVYKKYIHIGLAVDTPAGLVVPVIRDADQKTIWQIAAEAAELATKAKDRKLKLNEMQGACFTISSLGNIGGTGFTPIVNSPEVGILGVSRAAIKPYWNGSEFVPRKMLPLALSYDHRAVNGADGGKFLTSLCQLLTDIRRMAL